MLACFGEYLKTKVSWKKIKKIRVKIKKKNTSQPFFDPGFQVVKILRGNTMTYRIFFIAIRNP